MDIQQPEKMGFSTSRLTRIRPYMQRYIDQGITAGIISLVSRCGEVVHLDVAGQMDIEANKPMQEDAIFRIYSMTKPITSAAVIMLLEEGLIRLFDPISDYLPEFKTMRVLTRRSETPAELEDARRPITIRDLLTHTAGLSYGFTENDYLDLRYRKEVWKEGEDEPDVTTETMVKRIAQLPLAFQPGTAFNYSMSIDVLGYLVQIVSGKSFDVFLRERIFEPLSMPDTDFWVPPDKVDRFAKVYGPKQVDGKPDFSQIVDIEPVDKSHYYNPVQFHSGGGGLVSTTADYLRFCTMILNGGVLDGVRLLGRKSVELMRMNHLPDGVFLDNNPASGFGFGLGGSVLLNPAQAQIPGTAGTWGWGGAANTKFWIDFEEQVIAILMLQYMPNDIYPLESDFRSLVYQALEN